MLTQLAFNYRPQRSCEGYVFTGMCLSTGGCLPQCMLGNPPGADTPLGSRHPPGADTPQGADTPGSRPPGADTPLGEDPPGSRQPPLQTATTADGTHPTGMHSCYNRKIPANQNLPEDNSLNETITVKSLTPSY